MNGMAKAGLIGLAAGAISGLGITLLIPICTPCAAIVIGLGVGFLACFWDKPLDGSSGAGLGAKAGAIAGAGHLGGQLLGMLINSLLVGPEQAAEMFTELFSVDVPATDPATYWVSQIVINGGCGITSIVVAAGLGALGGLLWYQARGKKSVL